MIKKVLLLNKPIGFTSFYCVRKVRALLPRGTRVGHTGTLDPFASGLLIICIGKQATTHISSFMHLEKRYQARAELNLVTDTLDHTGTTVATNTAPHPSRTELQAAIASFMPQYTQTPPHYSALKHNGTPLYELARNKTLSPEELQIIATEKRREVTLYECLLAAYEKPFFDIDATVSQGTYIRTLMHDIAQKAGSIGATTITLHRSHIGPFSCTHALPFHELNKENLYHESREIDEMLTLIRN